MNWSEQTWEQAHPIYQRIVSMPFIRELMNGKLETEKFRFYISQDSIYLEHFGKALALIAARAERVEDSLSFISFAQNAILVEQSLHESYFKEFGVAGRGIAQPACHHYIHFLKSTTALETVAVGMAAVLPCFWIYKAVGDHIIQHQAGGPNPYQKWIDTYGGEDFAQAVQQAIMICDRVAATVTERTRTEMTDAFITASRLEYDFWDGAYQLKKW
ncbi:MAG TPA: thiaminase II [Chitinophagaceae bacterium]|nr:thiaminase II [Chitinophagaceae bacterium]